MLKVGLICLLAASFSSACNEKPPWLVMPWDVTPPSNLNNSVTTPPNNLNSSVTTQPNNLNSSVTTQPNNLNNSVTTPNSLGGGCSESQRVAGACQGCKILLDLKKKWNQPLYLTKSDGSEFTYPTSKATLEIGHGKSVLLYCQDSVTWTGPENKRKQVVTKNELMRGSKKIAEPYSLTCKKGEFYEGSTKVNVKDVGCKKVNVPILQQTSTKCSNEGADGRKQGLEDLYLIEIGWKIGNNFHPQITTCHDAKALGPLWAKHYLRGTFINNKESVKGRPSFRTLGKFVKKTKTLISQIKMAGKYSKKSQKAAVTKIVGKKNNLIAIGPKDTKFLAKGHLAPDADFVYDSSQDATYFYANAAPQFQSFNAGNWLALEARIRKLAISMSKTLTIWTGTFDLLEYPDKKNVLQDIYLDVKLIPVPKYFWKIVYDKESQAGAAFIGLNDPNAQQAPTTLCSNKCTQMNWVKDHDWTGLTKGYVYCCTITEAIQQISTIPINSIAHAIPQTTNLIQDPNLPSPTGEVPAPADAA